MQSSTKNLTGCWRSEWIEQVGHCLAECTIYDESARKNLSTVRAAMEDLRAHLEGEEGRDYLDAV